MSLGLCSLWRYWSEKFWYRFPKLKFLIKAVRPRRFIKLDDIVSCWPMICRLQIYDIIISIYLPIHVLTDGGPWSGSGVIIIGIH